MSTGRYDALFLDAFGTLITVDRPGERLRDGVARSLGQAVPIDVAERAFIAEATHYAGQCHRGVDRPSLDALNQECAAIALAELEIELDPATAVELLGDTIVYAAYPDAVELVGAARAAQVTVAVVSNFDYTLPHVLTAAGLEIDPALALSSAATGSSKPDPGIFQQALHVTGVPPARVLHVGDTPAADAIGAAAAGIDVRIVDRDGAYPDRIDTVASLTEIVELIA